MLLEAIIIIATIFIIALVFYKQTNPEYKILQVENGDLQKLPYLIPELSPIVIRGFKVPNFWTRADVQARPRLQQIPLAYRGFMPTSLIEAVTNPALALPTVALQTASLLAQESGIQVWAEHTILPVFTDLWYNRCLTIQTQALISNQGLQETTALLTVIFPTEGDLQFSLLHKKQAAYCPAQWQGTMPATWTKETTPLVGEIQFIDVIIRKGTALALPPHWRWAAVATESIIKPMIAVVEVHHPISALAAKITKN
jgi:hypothetical protein